MANGKGWKALTISSLALSAVLITGMIVIYWWSSTTIILVVRHGERDDTTSCTAPTNNPPLSTAGQTRADTLAHVVEDTGLQAIYASEFCRTQQTVAAVATDLSLSTNVLSQHATDGSADITALVEQINTTHVGQKVLVAGHQSTVKKLIEDLGGGTIDNIESGEFDNLYVVTITRGWWRWFGYGKRVRVVRLKYGAPSPVVM
ncbi:MAG: phosphoglycerate mutase family protein [Pyrinomonadaceae bacterium]